MSYSGFQLGHPEITMPAQIKHNSALLNAGWLRAQQLIAATALILLSPALVLIWLAVKVSSPGKFLFAQDRPGLNGKPFRVYKIRTMHCGSEKSTALGVNNSDSRVTTVGKVLRALKLDELPQLWNIVTGDMVLVGPRPIPVALDQELRKKIPGFEKRYAVRPGLTSLGQICVKDNSLGEGLVRDWKLRFLGELHYISNRCIRYDLLMISMTTLYVFRSLIRK